MLKTTAQAMEFEEIPLKASKVGLRKLQKQATDITKMTTLNIVLFLCRKHSTFLAGTVALVGWSLLVASKFN
jgi:hypothetical protein